MSSSRDYDRFRNADGEAKALVAATVRDLRGQAIRKGADMSVAEYRLEVLKAMAETEFQAFVVKAAHAAGWLVAHFRKARIRRADGSIYYATPAAVEGVGWPDLVLVKRRVLYREVKTERGVVSPDQQAWLDALGAAGADAKVWRPRDLEEIETELLQ